MVTRAIMMSSCFVARALITLCWLRMMKKECLVELAAVAGDLGFVIFSALSAVFNLHVWAQADISSEILERFPFHVFHEVARAALRRGLLPRGLRVGVGPYALLSRNF